MARSSAAAAAPPARRRKPAHAAPRHASTQPPRRATRRTSGPKRPGAAAGARPARAAAPRTTPAVRRPPKQRSAAAPLVQRLIHGRTGALVDRLLRGRACVALVFALLVGIVFFNVSLLEMNEGIANTNARATALEHENAKLRGAVAPLASSERIQREAVKRGYSLPAAGDVGYVDGDPSANAKRAVELMTAPGIGEGTASRPAAQVLQETQAENAATATPAPAPGATPPTEPVAATPSPATSPPVTATAPSTTTAP